MAVSKDDITKTVVRYDNDYGVDAADGRRIGLPFCNHKKVKLPVIVTTVTPQEGVNFYTVTILPLPYSGFVDMWTDKIFNSPYLLELASKSLPRSAGFAMFGITGAIVGAILAVLFTPSNITPDTTLSKTLDDGVQVVYWVMTSFR
jgi:hypothetical protein